MRFLTAGFLCSFLLLGVLSGQTGNGTITGTIADPGGAVVANAAVEAKQVDTGAVFAAVSTPTGNYTIAQLPIGTYEVSVSVAGFKKFVRTGITVSTAQVVRIDANLQVGAVSESVTVAADSSLLKTETADVSHNVTNEMLNTLPMLGVGSAASGSSGIRNPNNVLEVIPGTYYAPNSQVKINGAPSNSQAYHVEGMDTTNQGFPYAAAQVQQSVDAIQEISVQTSNFAPEFGAAGGGFFNVTMRSGTNGYHGTVYDYLVNEALNAGTPFTDAGSTNSLKSGQLVRPRARRNDYGWTIGGPVSIPKVYDGHDKTFFFFNFEQFRETQSINNIPITVPIDAYRQGNFSQAISALKAGGQPLSLPGGAGSNDVLGRPLIANTIYDPSSIRVLPSGQTVADPFTGNIVPTNQLDKVALNVQKFMPQPNLPGLFNNYLPTYPSTRHSTIPAVKLDQNIGSRGKLSFYYSFTHTDSAYSPTYGASEGLPDQITATRGTFIHSHVERLNYDQTLTPTLLLHLGAGYQLNNFYDAAPITDFNAAATLGLVGATLNRNVPVFTGLCPPAGFGAACTAAGGIGNLGPSAGQSNDFWEKPSFNASATWVKQNHTFKLGGELYLNGTPSTSYTGTSGTFNFTTNQTGLPYLVGTTLSGGSLGFPYASFLMGRVDNYSIAQPAAFRFGKKQLAFFLQDSWKVSRKLTLDYGVRWDYGTYYKEQYGRGMGFSPTLANPNAGGYPGAWIFEATCKCNFASNYPYAIGPRIGMAYQITPKTVFRAGWGIVYNATSTNNGGVNTAGIAASNAVGNTGLGQPSMTLANGIPASSIPSYPNFNPGIAPLLPIGNQGTPVLGVGGFSNAGLIDAGIARPARQNQWSFGLQREITRNLALEVSYVGNRGVWWNAGGLVNVNALTPQRLAARGIDITNATQLGLLTQQLGSAAVQAAGFRAPYAGFSSSQTLAQSLRPFPQFGTINAIGSPLGKTWYDSLQAKATQRFSHGLTFTSAFTWQKNLQQGVDSNAVLNNIIANPANSKSLSSFDQPFTFVISASYTTPKLGINKALSYAVRDWNVGTILQYASGLPIATPTTASTLNSQLFQNTLANRVAGQPLYATTWVDRNGKTQTTPLDINCKCFDPAKTFALNPAAWANPANGQFSNSAEFYSDFRYQRHPNESIGLGRTFKFTERMNLMVRVDFSNVFNRTYLNNPSNAGYLNAQSKNPATGLNSGGFGYINLATTGTQFGQPRNGTLVARFTF